VDRIMARTDGRRPVGAGLNRGETGSGKTAIARWLHQQGPRANEPLVE
jgi:transcriptional regulator with GAF, ATPase, and Fis domain